MGIGLLAPSRRTSVLGSLLLAAALAAPFEAAAQLVISDFRVRGPSGANDEYVTIANNSGADHTVAGGGTGYALAASDGVARCVIPNGTVIPNNGAYLCVNSVAYSLASYPAGNGTTATGDATYTTDIPDNAGIALFNTSVAVNFILANRMDAVGSTSEANTLYKEGTGYPALTPFSIDYGFYRDRCGKSGSITTFGVCPDYGVKDTNNNAADFVFVDTNGTSAGAGQRLGAPGPRNLSSPISGTTSTFAVDPLDSCSTDVAPPNRVRDFTSDPANNSTFGTLDHRLTVTNNTGGNVTRMRWRVVDLTTFPAPSGIADLRPRTSTAVVVTVDRPACGAGTSNVTVEGTTLEQPPNQPNGGGFNSSWSSGTVTLGTPLANGATIDVRFLLGIQQTGNYKFGLILEALPGGSSTYYFEGCTDGTCFPSVTSITRVNADPTSAASVDYLVTFDQSVTAVDTADFALTTTGTIAGASITGVSGAGNTRTVTVSTGTGLGTIRLDVIDNDTIMGAGLYPLGGTGLVNGDFITGEVYNVDRTPPTVTINQGGAQLDPTTATPITFDVVFNEAVTGFTGAMVSFTGSTAPGVLVANVAGAGPAYTVTVTGMTGGGTVVASIPAAATTDMLGNASLASTSTDNTVTFIFDITAPTVTINQAVAQLDPTTVSPVNFTATFSENVTGFTAADVSTVGSTAPGVLIVNVTGGPAIYNVAVSGMTGNGIIMVNIPAAAAIDVAANPSAASTSADNTVLFNGFAVTTYTAPSATGTGNITASFTGGGVACTYTVSQFIGAPPGAPPIPPTTPPVPTVFPHGLFNFSTGGCTVGSTLTFTVTYPQPLAPTTQYWKYGPTAADPAPHWYVLPAAIAGNVATFTITDGGLGDDDLTANGTIVDQGGPGVPLGPGALPTPTMSEWAMILLALLLLAFGAPQLRTRS